MRERTGTGDFRRWQRLGATFTMTVAMAGLATGYGCVGDEPTPVAPPNGTDGGGSDGAGGGDGSPQADGGAADAPIVCAPSQTACGTTCADLQQSGDHCGACDHGCGGGACAQGLCQPHTFATGIDQLHAISGDATHLYFTAGNFVQRCLKSGACAGAGLTKLADFTGQNEDGTGSIVATNGLAAFLGNTNGDTRFYVCSGAGCPSPLGGALGVSVNGYDGPWAATAGGAVYVVNPGSGIFSATCAGAGTCTSLAKRHDKSLAQPPLAADGTHYYFVKKVANAPVGIARCPESEATCATVSDVVTGALSSVKQIFVSGTQLYVHWAGGQGGGSAIGQCPVAGCATPTKIRDSIATFADVAVSGTDVFWIDGTTVRTCPAASCGAPRDLATVAAGAEGLSVDAKFVYWVEGKNTAAGTVRRVAR